MYNNKKMIHKCQDIRRTKSLFLQQNRNKEVNIVKNIENTLTDLDDSLKLSSQLEAELMLNAGSRAHRHMHLDSNQNIVTEKCEDNLNAIQLSMAPTSISNSKSTASLANKEHQFEGLLCRYQDWLKDVNKKTNKMSVKDLQLADAQSQILDLMESIDELNKTITKICCKYFVLKRRKDAQKLYYEEQMSRLRHCAEELLELLRKSRMDQELLTKKLAEEYIPLKTSLIKETRRSELVYQENLHLKQELKKLTSASACWKFTSKNNNKKKR